MHAKVFIVLLLWNLPVSLTMPQITTIASIVIPLFSLPDEPQPSLTFGPSLSFRTWFALRSYVPLLPRRAFFSSWTRKTWKSWRSWQIRISPVNDSKLLWKWELRRCMSEQRSKRQHSETTQCLLQNIHLSSSWDRFCAFHLHTLMIEAAAGGTI